MYSFSRVRNREGETTLFNDKPKSYYPFFLPYVYAQKYEIRLAINWQNALEIKEKKKKETGKIPEVVKTQVESLCALFY